MKNIKLKLEMYEKGIRSARGSNFTTPPGADEAVNEVDLPDFSTGHELRKRIAAARGTNIFTAGRRTRSGPRSRVSSDTVERVARFWALVCENKRYRLCLLLPVR